MRSPISYLAPLLVSLGLTAGLAGTAHASPSKPRATAVDRAFVREMVPHHQMAVEMARMAQRQGTHAKLKAAATNIVTAQGEEIRQLRRIARRLGVTPAAMDDHERMMEDAELLGLTMDQMGMAMDMSELERADPFDRMFIDMMIDHHRGAIRMARAELRKGRDGELRRIARAIVRDQTKEIRSLSAWRKAWYGAESASA